MLYNSIVGELSEVSMHELMAVTKALADENRVRTLLALKDSELCVCQIIELLGLAPSTVSKHVAILKQARLVESTKRGRWVFYRLAGEESPPEAREALAWVLRSALRTPELERDRQRLKEILKMDREVLCRQHADSR
jgi:DNA-binding transcriptional ArsR family regulator